MRRIDRIRTMSVTEMAAVLIDSEIAGILMDNDIIDVCKSKLECSDYMDEHGGVPPETCIGCLVEWLMEEGRLMDDIQRTKLIGSHIEECKHRIGVINGFMETNSDADEDNCCENILRLKTAISALEELRQYRNRIEQLKHAEVIQFRCKLPDGRICHFSDFIDFLEKGEVK